MKTPKYNVKKLKFKEMIYVLCYPKLSWTNWVLQQRQYTHFIFYSREKKTQGPCVETQNTDTIIEENKNK